MIATFDQAPGPMERGLARDIASLARRGRRELHLSQASLSDVSGIPQTAISRIERADARHIRLHYVAHLFDVLGVRVALSPERPVASFGSIQKDVVHSHLLAQIARRLIARRWQLAREVPIGGHRIRGWIDILAWYEAASTVLVVEAKSTLRDLGELERQVGWYEGAAIDAARPQGWRPRFVAVLVAALATSENAAFVRANAGPLRIRFPVRPNRFQAHLEDPVVALPTPARALAFIDPARTARRFLLPTPLFPGTLVVPYERAMDLLRSYDEASSPPQLGRVRRQGPAAMDGPR